MTKQQRIDELLKERQELLDDIYVLIDEDNVNKMVEVKVRYGIKRVKHRVLIREAIEQGQDTLGLYARLDAMSLKQKISENY